MSDTLERVLSEAIKPDTSGDGNWDGVVGTVRRRHRRRAVAFRSIMLSFVLFGGLALVLSLTGSGVETIPAPSDFAEPVELIDSRWPSAQTVFDATEPRPTWHLWLGWLVGLGLPALAGLGAWLAAPRHLRAEVASQRFTRLYVAAVVAFVAGLVLVGLLWVPTFFVYDALAVATSQSVMFTLFVGVLNGLPWLAGTAAFALVMTDSGFFSQAPVVSRVGVTDRLRGVFQMTLALLGAYLLGGFVSGFEGLLRWSAWEQSVGTEPAGRGMWRPMIPGSQTFLNADGFDISASGSIIALLVAALFAWLMWRFCRRSIDMALAGERFSFDVLGRLREVSGERYVGCVLLVIGVLLPLWSFANVLAQTDRLATSTAPPPAMGEVSTQVDRARSPIGNGPLVTVSYWARGLPEGTELADEPTLPVESLLPSDWVSESCAGSQRCSDFRHVDSGDLWLVSQPIGETDVRLVGEPNQDARVNFPFLLFGGLLLSLFGGALHWGRGVRYVVGTLATAASLLMVRASLSGFSRTAALFGRAEDELGLNIEDLTLEQAMTEPIFDGVASTWPSWHYPFAFTSLALWLAATVGGIAVIRPNRRWTAATTTLAVGLLAWAVWQYSDIAELANTIAE